MIKKSFSKMNKRNLIKYFLFLILFFACVIVLNQSNKERLAQKLEYHFVPDQTLSFDFSVKNSGFVLTNKLQNVSSSSSNNIEFRAKGNLDLFVASKNLRAKGSILKGFSFIGKLKIQDLSTYVNKNLDPSYFDEKRLSIPFELQLKKNGSRINLWLDSNLNINELNLIDQIVQEVFPKLPENEFDSKNFSWESYELFHDLKFLSLSEINNWFFQFFYVYLTKTYQKDSADLQFNQQNSMSSKISGKSKLVFDPNLGFFMSISGQKTISKNFGKMFSGTDEAQFSVRFAGLNSNRPSWINDFYTHSLMKSEGGLVPLSGLLSSKRDLQKRENYRGILGNDNLNSILVQMRDKKSELIRDWMEVSSKLFALLKLNSLEAIALKLEMKNLDPRKQYYQTIMANLIRAGDENSQQVLLELLRESIDKEDDFESKLLLQNIGFLENPNSKMIATVEQISQTNNNLELFSRAILTLGNFAGNLKRIDYQNSLNIFEKIKFRLDQEDEINNIRLFIASLGNIGIEEQLNVLEKYLLSKNDQIRRDALLALRFVENKKAKLYLQKSLINEPDNHLREVAAEAYEFQELNTADLEFLNSRLLHEKNSGVLIKILKAINHASSFHPDVKAILLKYQKICTVDEVCQFNKGLLNSL